MLILWLIAKLVFFMLVAILGIRGDISLGEYLIILALMFFVGDPERRTK